MKILAAAILAATALSAIAQTHVQGYTRKDGTYVAPYVRTAPDHTNLNNYSTQGNYNPYTGSAGTVQPNYSYTPPAPIQPVYTPRTPACTLYANGQYVCN